jgi:hypothetical protein
MKIKILMINKEVYEKISRDIFSCLHRPWTVATKQRNSLTQEISDGKALTVIDEVVYVVDKSNRLLSLAITGGSLITPGSLVFNSPAQISHADIDAEPILILREPGRLVFTDSKNVLGFISTNAERVSIIPTGGTIDNPANYRKKVLYSASHKILDFSTDRFGNVFVLFSDSVVALDTTGSYKNRIIIDQVPLGSKILTTPVKNNVVVYDHAHKSIKTLTGIKPNQRNDIIALTNNHPNPVDNYTEIEFSVGQFLDLTITVYNLIGEPVKVIARGRFPKGTHRVIWHAVDERGNLVPNGIYFYRLESKKGVAIKQLTVLR